MKRNFYQLFATAPTHPRWWTLALACHLSVASFAQTTGPYPFGSPPVRPTPNTVYYTTGPREGLPTYLDPVRDDINPADNPNFTANILAALPDGVNRTRDFGTGPPADLLVNTDGATVYLTFVSAVAGYRNSLGYYFYRGEAPTDLSLINPLVAGGSTSYLGSRRIIFPNASGVVPSGNGKLVPGDRVKLIGDRPDSTFSAGVRIAWFVVSNGWDSEGVHPTRSILYSNARLNRDGIRYATVLNFTRVADRTLISFEDAEGGGDRDYNDVVFYATGLTGGNTVFFPNCAGQFVLPAPVDPIKCTDASPLQNLAADGVCADEPLKELRWRVVNPNAFPVPFAWTITDGTAAAAKLQSEQAVVAAPGESFFTTRRVSGVNVLTLAVGGVGQPSATRVAANLTACTNVTPPALNCCATWPARVVAYRPGTTAVGVPLVATSQNPALATGATGPASSFVPLGFAGRTADLEASVTLRFDRPVRGQLNIYETTFGAPSPNFIETADVYGSPDGSTFYYIGLASNQLSGELPNITRTTLALTGEYATIQYVKVVSTTARAAVPGTSNGFDLEAVCASEFAPAAADANPNATLGSLRMDAAGTRPSQGAQRNGLPVWSAAPNRDTDPACVATGTCDPEGINRCDPASILARDDRFFSLGIGGSLEVEFPELLTGSLILFERTGDPRPSVYDYTERVEVFVKATACQAWTSIGFADNQGDVLGQSNGSFDHQTYRAVLSLGGRVARFVRLVDATPTTSTSRDGYDVDFIGSTSNASGNAAPTLPALPGDGNASGRVGLTVTPFPNPSTGSFSLDFGYQTSGYVDANANVVTVSDPMGRAVLRTVRPAEATGPLPLDLTGQPSGLYFVRVETGSATVSTKILLRQ